MEMDRQLHRENKLMFIAIFLILFLSAGFTSVNDILPNAITKGLWGVLLIILMYKSKLKCLASQLYVTIALCIIILLSTLINNASIMNTINYCFGFLCVFFLVSITDNRTILKVYVNVIYVLCIISLFCWLLFWIIPAIRAPFYVTNAAGNIYSDILLYSFNANVVGIPRNQGMFWEPGAFSTFIVLALVFETLNDSINFKRIIIFLITVLTTFSTTGYLTILVYVIYLYFKNKDNVVIRRLVVVSVLLISLIMVLAWGYLSETGTYSVFGKLIDFKNSGSYGKRVTSVSIRIDSIIKPISVFFEYPLFGCGNEKITVLISKYTHGMNTCTFVNWFAIYGLFFGIIMFVGLIKASKILAPDNFIMRLLIILLLLMSIMSENYVNSPIIFMIILCGYGFSGEELNSAF